MSNARKLLHLLIGVKKTKNGWSARCPAHEDRKASLSIDDGDEGRVIVRCHRGCDHKKIVAALGLEESDLFNRDDQRPATTKASKPKKAGKAYATAKEAVAAYERTLGKPARSWTYRDRETLDEVGRVLRWDRPAAALQAKPSSWWGLASRHIRRRIWSSTHYTNS